MKPVRRSAADAVRDVMVKGAAVLVALSFIGIVLWLFAVSLPWAS